MVRPTLHQAAKWYEMPYATYTTKPKAYAALEDMYATGDMTAGEGVRISPFWSAGKKYYAIYITVY